MNEKLTELALQIGGSHYPAVSKQYLEYTVRLVIKQLADQGYASQREMLQEFDLE